MLPNNFFLKNQQKNGAANSFFALAFFDAMVDQWDQVSCKSFTSKLPLGHTHVKRPR
jgi:hypothetical protein